MIHNHRHEHKRDSEQSIVREAAVAIYDEGPGRKQPPGERAIERAFVSDHELKRVNASPRQHHDRDERGGTPESVSARENGAVGKFPARGVIKTDIALVRVHIHNGPQQHALTRPRRPAERHALARLYAQVDGLKAGPGELADGQHGRGSVWHGRLG